MNVLEVYPHFLPERGGVERHIHDLCRCLKERGHNPFVFAWLSPGLSTEIIDGILIQRTRIPSLFKQGPFAKYGIIFFLCLQIVRLAHKYRIDLIHAHDYLPGLASALAGMFLRKPVFVTFHLPIWRTTYQVPNRSLLKKVLKKCFISRVSVIICVSMFTFEETVKLGFPRSKLKVIYNWITPLPKCGVDDFNDVVKKFNLQGKRFILSVGRLVDAQKGFSMLIDAHRTLIDRGHDMDLLIVGDGPDKEMLIKKTLKLDIKNRVHLLSQVSDRELACLYQECEVFVLPSLFEGLPLVLLEAMSLGKPIVATKVGGVPEIIEDEHNGILVERRQDSLATGIERLLTNPPLKNRLIENSEETLKKFSIKNLYYTIYLFEIISKRFGIGGS